MINPGHIEYFDGHKCSRIYTRLLTVARAEGVKFRLDSGYRSIAEQWHLWRLYKAGLGALAAFPGTSTHNIRGYRQGLDINSLDGGTVLFRRWAITKGITFDWTVPGEAWHLNARKNYVNRIDQLWTNHLRHHGH